MGSYALYPMGFYELQPKYLCKFGDEWTRCTNIDFCQNLQYGIDPKNETGGVLTTQPEWRLDHSDPTTLYNWIEQFELQCAPKSDFGKFGSLFFIGVVISSFIFPRISDIYGRKKIAMLG